MATRRQFIQAGVLGGALLVAMRYLDRQDAGAATAWRFLDRRRATLVEALVPVVLEGSLPAARAAHAQAVREVVEAFDRAVAGLDPAVRDEIAQMMGVLLFAPTRALIAGVWSDWQDARPAEVAAFLNRWRTSAFALQRAGYRALTQLIQAAWYDNPSAWLALGYPGPPTLSAKPKG